MRYTGLLLMLSVLFLSCDKDKFETKPSLTLKDVNTKILVRGQVLRFNLAVTDKEGDLNDTLHVFKVTRNCTNSNFNQKYKLPLFPESKNSDLNLEVAYSYGINPNGIPTLREPQCTRNDSCFFRFVIRDKAGNVSDTVNSAEIVLIR
jgi:hypothetical protein